MSDSCISSVFKAQQEFMKHKDEVEKGRRKKVKEL